jgi:hypothetical protein
MIFVPIYDADFEQPCKDIYADFEQPCKDIYAVFF